MEYSLAEVIDMMKEHGFRDEELPTATIMFSMAFFGVDSDSLKSFTGYDAEVDRVVAEMTRLEMIDGDSVVGTWIETWDKSAVGFTMDVYSVLGYFIVGYKNGERTYRSNPEHLHPYWKELDGK